MVPILIIASWLATNVVIVVLCVASRRGDEQIHDDSVPARGVGALREQGRATALGGASSAASAVEGTLELLEHAHYT
jgi:hypothetical protein